MSERDNKNNDAGTGSSIWFASGNDSSYVDRNGSEGEKKRKSSTMRNGKSKKRNDDMKTDSRRRKRENDGSKAAAKGKDRDSSRKSRSEMRDKNSRTVHGKDERARASAAKRIDESGSRKSRSEMQDKDSRTMRGIDERTRANGTVRDDERKTVNGRGNVDAVDGRTHTTGSSSNSERSREQSRTSGVKTEKRTSTQKPKRVTKQNTEMSMAKRIFIGIVLILVFIAVGAFLIVRYAFDIKTIKVSGNTIYDEQEIISLSDVELGESLFMLNTESVVEAINEDPFLCATVKKNYPNTLIISITERIEFAKVFHSDSYIIIDADGTALKICSEDDGNREYAGLLTITGMNASGAQIGKRIAADNKYYAAALFDVLDELVAQSMIANVLSVDMTNPFDIYLYTTDGISVRIGQAEALDVKIGLLPQLISKARSNGYSGGIIDVSVETCPTYEFPQPIATPTPTPTMPQTGEPTTLPQNTATPLPTTIPQATTPPVTQSPETATPTVEPTTAPDISPMPTQGGQS